MKPLASASAEAALSSPSATAIISLVASVASGPRSAIFSAQAFASASALPVSTTRSTTPSDSASGASSDLAAERQPPDGLRAEAAHGALRARPAGHDADGCLGEAELDLRLGDAEVAGGGEFQPAAERMAVKARRWSAGAAVRGGRRRDGRSAPTSPGSRPALSARPGVDIAAGAKALALAAEEHGAHAVGILGGVECCFQRAQHRDVERVEFSGRRSVTMPTAPSCSKVTRRSDMRRSPQRTRAGLRGRVRPIGASAKRQASIVFSLSETMSGNSDWSRICAWRSTPGAISVSTMPSRRRASSPRAR